MSEQDIVYWLRELIVSFNVSLFVKPGTAEPSYSII